MPQKLRLSGLESWLRYLLAVTLGNLIFLSFSFSHLFIQHYFLSALSVSDTVLGDNNKGKKKNPGVYILVREKKSAIFLMGLLKTFK